MVICAQSVDDWKMHGQNHIWNSTTTTTRLFFLLLDKMIIKANHSQQSLHRLGGLLGKHAPSVPISVAFGSFGASF
jgi:hypothetical protein